ncbi:sodium- and chloride-dependent creatine transporter 1-like [Ylistrum balloti]|uniref:sodium- and chloride-dependent creatine transporter 1-like n=1 Tax=Ylistrum balloti TaxID=509963 RepID=UPI002905F696|nr:sodium- and chloride-dependent creatine transporter 1-like [Ylistrum balloti]
MASTDRGTWSNRLEFLFSCIGVTVGLGNIWRFPYICYKNGGGAFLIPYFLFLVLIGTPCVFLQFTYAQYSNLGPGKVWECCPLFRGIGYGMMTLTFIVGTYYGVILSWTLYYFGHSFFSVIPWATCDNEWNTPMCSVRTETVINRTTTVLANISTTGYLGDLNMTSHITPPEEFWENNVLQLTESIQTFGTIRWELLLGVLATSIVIFFCLIKGIHSSGKVMYVMATIPYVFLMALLIRGMTLPGSLQGMEYYMKPRWKELSKLSVWVDAAAQTFYSLSLSSSALILLASHNKFHNNIYRDAIIIPICDAFTSWFAGCVVFVTLGYMAQEANLPMEKVVEQGPGVAFIVYPEALSTLQLPQLWSALFFLMLFTVGLDSQIVHIQLLYTGLADNWPGMFGRYRLLTLAGIILASGVCGIVFTAQGGMYAVQLTDWYLASLSILLLVGVEATVLAWIYGADRLYKDIEAMIGYQPNKLWKVLWKFVTPPLISVLWLIGVINHQPVTYGLRPYPAWSIGVGWIIAFLPLIPIPITMYLTLRRLKGSVRERFSKSLKPTDEWKPAMSSDPDDKDVELNLNGENGFV